MIKVGINGIGRIGRAIVRANNQSKLFEVVAINDINPDINNVAYMMNYDTLYGRTIPPYEVQDDCVTREGKKIKIFHEQEIDAVDWKSLDADYIIDASGLSGNISILRRMRQRGAIKRAFITHSPNDVDFTMVIGANHLSYRPDDHFIISTSICDATALGPVLKIINDKFGIDNGYVTTLHPWLNYQNLMDGASSSWSVPGEIYHHYALGRSVDGNIIPKPTSAIEATAKVVNGISEENIGSYSYRTPTAIVGSADITLNLKKSTNCDSVIEVFDKYQENQEFRIIKNNIEPLVSLDFLKCDFSAVVDHRWTKVIDGKLLKLVLWYDNEFGYSSRVVDQINYVIKQEKMS